MGKGFWKRSISVVVSIILMLTMGQYGMLTNTVFAQETSGYQIGVSYDGNGGADLTADVTNVAADKTLQTLTDSQGNSHDPNTFQSHVDVSGEYLYELTYMVTNGDQTEERKEEIKVNVEIPEVQPATLEEEPATPEEQPTTPEEEPAAPEEQPTIPEENPAVPEEQYFDIGYQLADDKLTATITIEEKLPEHVVVTSILDPDQKEKKVGERTFSVTENGTYTYTVGYHNQATGEKGSQKLTVTVEGIEQPKEITVEELKQQRAVNNIYQYTWNAYSDNGAELRKGIKFTEGNIQTSEEGIPNTIDNYIFEKAVIIVSGQYYDISAIYRLDGQDYYVPAVSANEPGIAYQSPKNSEYQLIYKINTQDKYPINKDKATTEGWDIQVDAEKSESGIDEAYEGQIVIVKYIYPHSLDPKATREIQVKKSNEEKLEVKVLNEDPNARSRTISFEMPKESVTIYGVGTEKSGKRWVGVYGTDTAFQEQERGMNGVKGLGILEGLIYKVTPTGGEDSLNGGAAYTRSGNQGIKNGKDTTSGYYTNDGDEPVVVNKDLLVATSEYTIGSGALSFEYQVKRGRLGMYKYEPSNYIVIDFFPNQGTYETDQFVRELVPLPRPSTDNIGTSMKTTLSNGVEVTTILKERGKLTSGSYVVAYDTVYQIDVSNVVDDFRVGGGTVSSVQGNYMVGNLEGLDPRSYIVKDFDGDGNTETKDEIGYTELKSGLTFLAKDVYETNGQNILQFNLTTKDGYTIPTATITDVLEDKRVTDDEKNLNPNSIWPRENSDGTLYWGYDFKPSGDHFSYRFDFQSKLMTFDFNFLNKEEAVISSYNGYDVPSRRYFSIPQLGKETASPDGNAMTGWKLYVNIPGKGDVEIYKNESNKGESYLANDLVDVRNVWKQILGYSTKNPQFQYAQTKYTLSFKPQYGPVKAGAYVASKYEYNQQNGWEEKTGEPKYTNHTTESVYVIYGYEAIFTGYPETLGINGEYMFNITNSTMHKKIENADINNVFAKLNYDKKIYVEFEDSSNKLGITDTEAFDIATTVDGHNSTVQVPNKGKVDVTTNDENKIFKGWYVDVEGKRYGENGEENGTPFQPGATIQLGAKATLTGASGGEKVVNNEVLTKIFSSGNATFTPVWKAKLSPIKHSSATTTAPTDKLGEAKVDKREWLYDKTEFTVSAKFNYPEGQDSYVDALANNKIHYALYKQDPENGVGSNTNLYKLWASDLRPSTDHSAKVKGMSISETLDESGDFTVSFMIQDAKGSISYDWDNEANYRIVAWTSENGATSFTDDTLPDSSEATAQYPKVPYVTVKTKVLKPITVDGTASGTMQVQKKKLIFNGEGFSMQLDFQYDSRLEDLDALKQETDFIVAKKNSGEDSTYLWYKYKDGNQDPISGLGNGTAKPPEIALKGDGTATVTINFDAKAATTVLSSDAEYVLFVWNGSNSQTGPTWNDQSVSDPWAIKDMDTIIQSVPSLKQTTYVSQKDADETLPDAMFEIPNVTLNETVEDQGASVSSTGESLAIQLKGVWHDKGGQIQTGEEASPNDETVLHDYYYQVNVKGSGTGDPKIQMTQEGTSAVFTADYLRYKNNKFETVTSSNLNLGELGFASNGKSSSVRFGIKGTKPEYNGSRNAYTGSAEFEFVRVTEVKMAEGGVSQ
ncbi:MAG TPA: hypothetical protein H9858_07080 [Candidatus Blautia stercoravium]|nr:hypothetical protein [Candidatus Blautia stercoravium]